jgi:hypothetical protein
MGEGKPKPVDEHYSEDDAELIASTLCGHGECVLNQDACARASLSKMRLTSVPRRWAGAVSAIYTGTERLAIPTPMPVRMRHVYRRLTLSTIASPA